MVWHTVIRVVNQSITWWHLPSSSWWLSEAGRWLIDHPGQGRINHSRNPMPCLSGMSHWSQSQWSVFWLVISKMWKLSRYRPIFVWISHCSVDLAYHNLKFFHRCISCWKFHQPLPMPPLWNNLQTHWHEQTWRVICNIELTLIRSTPYVSLCVYVAVSR